MFYSGAPQPAARRSALRSATHAHPVKQTPLQPSAKAIGSRPITRMRTWYLLFASLVLIVGCVQNATTISAVQGPSSHSFGCWFVVSNGVGHSGYQAADFASSSATPQSQPLFKSIDELRVALRRQGVTNIDTIDGYTNGGWKIRGLTADELRALR